MNNSRLFRLSRIVIALTAASGMMVNTANAKEEAKAATQYTQQVNQNYAKSLPFSDRQDFDDAQRGFIAPLLDEGILRDANGKPYYRGEDYKFDINAPAPETVNPSLWRQSQINGISGLFKVTDKMYQVRGQDISNITFVEGEKGIIVIDPLVTPPAAKAAAPAAGQCPAGKNRCVQPLAGRPLLPHPPEQPERVAGKFADGGRAGVWNAGAALWPDVSGVGHHPAGQQL